MARVAIVYGSTEGQTATIAERIANTLSDEGHEPTLVHAKHLPTGFSLGEYDGCVVGASVHYGRHQRYVRHFVRDNVEALHARPSAFFSVSLTAVEDTAEARESTGELVEAFSTNTGWSPDVTATVAGALRYSQYGLLTRYLMRRIARKHGEETDPSRDYEYTDWDDVERFARAFAALLD